MRPSMMVRGVFAATGSKWIVVIRDCLSFMFVPAGSILAFSKAEGA